MEPGGKQKREDRIWTPSRFAYADVLIGARLQAPTTAYGTTRSLYLGAAYEAPAARRFGSMSWRNRSI